MRDFHKYATLKTTGQLVLDLGSITTHIAGLVAILRMSGSNQSLDILKWTLVATIIFQALVAIGLFIYRTMDLNNDYNHPSAHRLNYLFFAFLVMIAILESFIGIYEKFGLEHPLHGGGNNTCKT